MWGLLGSPSLWGLIRGSSPARIPILVHSLSITLETSWTKLVKKWMWPLVRPLHLRTMTWRWIMAPSTWATPSKSPWTEVMRMSSAWITHIKSWGQFISVAFTLVRVWSPRSLVLPGVVVRPRTCREKQIVLHLSFHHVLPWIHHKSQLTQTTAKQNLNPSVLSPSNEFSLVLW